MINKLLKNKIIIILIIVIIIFIIIKLVSRNTSVSNFTSTQKNSPSPISNSSTPQPTSTLNLIPIKNEIIDLNHQIPLARFLPYQGKYFEAKRYVEANELEVIVYRREETDLAKKEVQQWFTQNGVDQDDQFTIIYK